MKSFCMYVCAGLVAAWCWVAGGTPAWAEVDGNWEFYYSDADYTATVAKYCGTSTTPSVPSKCYRRINTGEKDEDGEYIYRTYAYQVTALYGTFKGNQSITSVSLPSSITNIGHSSFFNCSSLKSLSFSGTLSVVGECAFDDCEQLEDGFDVSRCTSIGNWAFNGCSAWPFGSLEFSCVTNIGAHAFSGCTGLKSIQTPSTLKTMGLGAFSGCTGLREASINGNELILQDTILAACSNLVSVTIGDGVTGMDYSTTTLDQGPFSYDHKLRELTVGSGITTFLPFFCRSLEGLETVTFRGNVEHISTSMFANCPSLKTLSIPNAPKSVGGSAFLNCENLVGAIDLSQCLHIGSHAFNNCRKLTFGDLSLPNATNIEYMAFYECNGLTAIDLSSNLKNLGNVSFGECKNLKRAQIDGTDLTLPISFLGGCTNLQNVVIGDGVVAIRPYSSSPFDGCHSLHSIDFGWGITTVNSNVCYGLGGLETIAFRGDIQSVEEGAFYNCSNLVTVSLGGSPKTIGKSAFYNCRRWNGHLDFSQCTNIGALAFAYCDGFSTIELPSCLQGLGAAAFRSCNGLTSARIDGTDLTLPCYVLADCTNLQHVVLGDGVTGAEENTDLYYYSQGPFPPFAGSLQLKTLEVGTGMTAVSNFFCNNLPRLESATFRGNVKHIGSYAFCRCSNLIHIAFGGATESIGSYAFYECSNATGEIDLSRVASIGSDAFRNCTMWVFGDLSLPNITNISPMAFYECDGLTSIDLPSKLQYLGSSSFARCKSLSRAQIDGADLTLPSGLLGGCTNLQSVVIGDGVVSISPAYSPFSGCLSLRSLEVGTGVTVVSTNTCSGLGRLETATFRGEIEAIEASAFSDCTNLVFLSFGGSPKTIGSGAFIWCHQLLGYIDLSQCTNVGSSAFRGCSSWSAGDLELTKITTVNSETFYGCQGVAGVKFGGGLTNIGQYAFAYCTSLSNVWFKGGVPSVGTSPFYRVASGARGCYGAKHRAEWQAVIGADGKWQGLLMRGPDRIENVRARPVPGTQKVRIFYDLNVEDGQPFDVNLSFKKNGVSGGMPPPAATISGDVGASVRPGKNKVMTWDAGTDVTETVLDDIVAEVEASREEETIEGESDEFDMELRREQFEIEDVESVYCEGMYGSAAGRHATFLAGVKSPVVFTVRLKWRTNVIRGIRVEDGLSEGVEIESGNRFRMDMGRFPAGGRMSVVAICEDDDGTLVESPPFRVNIDVAAKPVVFGIGEIGFDLGGDDKEMTWKKDMLNFSIGQSEASNESPWWLPNGLTTIRPLLVTKATYSPENATLTITPSLWGKQKDKTTVGWMKNGEWGKFVGFTLGMEANGVIAMRWDRLADGWLMDHLGLQWSMSGRVSKAWPAVVLTPIGMVPVYVRGTLEGELDTSLLYHGMGIPGAMQKGENWELTFKSDKLPKLTGTGGLGRETILYGEASLSGSGLLDGRIGGPRGTDCSYGVKATGELAFGYGKGRWWGKRFAVSLDTPPWWFFGEKKEESDSFKGPTHRAAALASRDARAADGVCNPLLAFAGDAEFRAWLRENGERAEPNAAELVFSAGGAWSGGDSVWDDGTADFSPSLGAAAGGTAVLAWCNAKRALSEEDGLEDLFASLEVAVAVRNGADGIWVATNLTDDAAADLAPQVAVAPDGTAMVAWFHNAAGGLFGTAAVPTQVRAARFADGVWSAPIIVVADAGAATDFDLAYDGTNGAVTVVFDADGNFETENDYAVAAAAWHGGSWGAATVLASGLADAGTPVARLGADGTATALWVEGGVLRERPADASSAAADALVRWLDGEVPATASPIRGEHGALALAWAEPDESNPLASHPVAMPWDAAAGTWGGPVAVARGAGRQASGISGAFAADGALALAWESTPVSTNAEGAVEWGAPEPRTATVPMRADPAVLAADFAFGTVGVVPGETTPVVAVLRNLGLGEVENVALRLFVGDGTGAETELFGETGEAVSFTLPGGASVAVTNYWTCDDSLADLTFRAVVSLSGGCDNADAGNDEAVWHPGTPDLWIENARVVVETANIRLLTATVRNSGLGPAPEGTVVSFRRGAPDGEEIGRDAIGAVLAGSANGYDAGIAWNMTGVSFTGAWETVYAVIDAGNATADASRAMPIRVSTALDPDGDGLLDAEEEMFGTDPGNADTDGDGRSDYDEVYIDFTDPLIPPPSHTVTTPVPVPHSWLDGYPEALAAHGDDREAFAADWAANGRNRVWECYVAGTDPTLENAEFKITSLSFEDGGVAVRWSPDLNENGTKSNRTYTVEGKPAMTNEWGPRDPSSHFFRVRVELLPQ